MADTSYLTIYILFLVFFSGLSGLFALSDDTKNFSLSDYTPISKVRDNLETHKNWFTSIISFVLIPFLVIDGVISIFVLMGIGFSIIPTILNIFILSPLVIIITYTYIIPTIRGN